MIFYIIVFLLTTAIKCAVAQHDPNYLTGREVMVHLMDWKFSDIAKECETFLGPKGYGGVQLSPVSENQIVNGRPWWERYQPVSYKVHTRSGTEAEFLDMSRRCNKAGIRLYPDVILNHMSAAGAQNPITGTAGSTADPGAREFPAVPYGPNDFNHPRCEINNWNNIEEIRNCNLVGLEDLNQRQDWVREKLIEHLNHLIDLGMAGFRIDAAKHMWPQDLDFIFKSLKNLNTEFGFEEGSRPFIYQEVIDYGNDVIKREEYIGFGAVTDFLFSRQLSKGFSGNDQLKWLKTYGPEWGLLQSKYSFCFVDNHDNQRDEGDILTYKNQRPYKMATAFALAHPHGHRRIMSSFDFWERDQGPPQDDRGNIISPTIQNDQTCAGGWICEHRWRQMYNMVDFRNVVSSTGVDNWWDNDNNQIAFSRGNKGFIVFNGESNSLSLTINTGLPIGRYCDIISGQREENKCSGHTIDVGENGFARIELSGFSDDGVMAIHVGTNVSERLIQFASENLVTEILIHPQFNTFIQCIRNLLSSFTRHRHIIHAGYTFAGNGSWILQDGTFSVSDFAEAFQDYEVQRVLRAYPDTITMDIHCAGNGLWSTIPDKNYAKTCKIRINPVDVLDSGSEKLNAFIDYLSPMVVPTEITDLLESSDVVGNIRFSHPTLYVFPGGQGDAALFGINGFNMLVDGGFSRKSCFWDFVRHLDRLDAVLMTRVNNSNMSGLSSVIERKSRAHVYPQIGHFFTNIPDRRSLASPDGDKDKDPLLIDLIEEGQKTITNLKTLNLKAQHCYRDSEPMNLYHKVGHGTLDMYVISPSKDSKEVKEFIQKWNNSDPKLFATKDSREFIFPLQNMVSICALLIWTPANPEDNVTRILFPGSTPQTKIYEGLDRIKSLEFLKTPVCTVKSLSTSSSSTTITKKGNKSGLADKIQADLVIPSKPISKPIERDNKAMDIDNKVTESKTSETKEEIKEIVQETRKEQQVLKSLTSGKPKSSKPRADSKRIENKIIKKVDAKDSDDAESQEEKKNDEDTRPEMKSDKDSPTEPKKDDIESRMSKTKTSRLKTDSRVVARSRIDTKPPKTLAERKIVKKDVSDTSKEVTRSSPPTPKKTVTKSTEETKIGNGSVVREVKKTVTRTVRASPKGTPAKSTKEANNRKVLESAQKVPVAKRDAIKQTKNERKPISHRTKTISPVRKLGASPSKKPIKTEKDTVIQKSRIDKNGTTDSSLVSTPSADEAAKRVIDTCESEAKPEDLEELKEEQEAVREIEAVFERDQVKDYSKKLVADDHREIHDSATEAEEEEEYLIIEKEEPYTEDSVNEAESSATKEEEIQKLQRDSEESEKRRKGSLEVTEEENEEEASEQEVEKEDGKSEKDQIQEQIDEEKPKQTIDIEDVKAEKDEEEIDAEEDKSGNIKEQLQEEVQEIIVSAKEIAKTRLEAPETRTDDISSATPEDKPTSKKSSEKEDDVLVDGEAHQQAVSQPEEKFSANAESGATTTAPTLPEDERCPLDEIKEDLVVEEKYVKEDTKESEVPPNILHRVYEPLERQSPPKLPIETTVAPHLRDIVKTPDEVADLPVHEEADLGVYEEGRKSTDKELQGNKNKVSEETDKEPEKTESERPESDKICDDEDVTNKVIEAVNEQTDTINELDIEATTDEPKVTSPEDEQNEKTPKLTSIASSDPQDNETKQIPEDTSRKHSIPDKSQPTSRKASTTAEDKSTTASRKSSVKPSSKPSSPDKSPPHSQKESLASSRKSSLTTDNKAASPDKSLPGSRKTSISKISSSKPMTPDKSPPASRKSSLKTPEKAESPEQPASVKTSSPQAGSRKTSTTVDGPIVSRKQSSAEDKIESEVCEDIGKIVNEPEGSTPQTPMTPTTTPVEKVTFAESPSHKEKTDKGSPEQLSKEPSKTSSPIPSEETIETQVEEIKNEQEPVEQTATETVQIISELKDGIATVVGLQKISKSCTGFIASEHIEDGPTVDIVITEKITKEISRPVSPEAMLNEANVQEDAEEIEEFLTDNASKAETEPSNRTNYEPEEVQQIFEETDIVASSLHEQDEEKKVVKIISVIKDGVATIVGLQDIPKSKDSTKSATPEPEVEHYAHDQTVQSLKLDETVQEKHVVTENSKESSKVGSPVLEINLKAETESNITELNVIDQIEKDAEPRELSETTTPEPKDEHVDTEQDLTTLDITTKDSSDQTNEKNVVKIIGDVKDGVPLVLGLQEIQPSKESSKSSLPEPESELIEKSKTVSSEQECVKDEKSKESSKVASPEPLEKLIESKESSKVSSPEPQEKVMDMSEKASSPQHELIDARKTSLTLESEISKEASKAGSPEPQNEEKREKSNISSKVASPEPQEKVIDTSEKASSPQHELIDARKTSVNSESEISKEASKAGSPEPQEKVIEDSENARKSMLPDSEVMGVTSKEASKAGSPEPQNEEKGETSNISSTDASPERSEDLLEKSKESSRASSPPLEIIASKKTSLIQETETFKESTKVASPEPQNEEIIEILNTNSKAQSPQPSEDLLEKSKESSKVTSPEPVVTEAQLTSHITKTEILKDYTEATIENLTSEPKDNLDEKQEESMKLEESVELEEAGVEPIKIISEIKDGVATIVGLTTSGTGSKASNEAQSPQKSPSKTSTLVQTINIQPEVKPNDEAINISEESFIHSASEQVEELVESIKSSAHHAVDFTKEDIKQIETEMQEAGAKIIESVKTEVASKVAAAEGDTNIFKDEMQKVVDDADKAVKDLVDTIQAEIVASTNVIDEQTQSLEDATKKNLGDVQSEAMSSIDTLRQELTDTKQEIEVLSKQTTAAAEKLKRDISDEIQKTMDSLHESAKVKVEETETQLTSGIGSFLGELTKDIKAEIDKVATSIESTISTKVNEIEEKVESITVATADVEPKIIPKIMKEVTTEIRETHITTVDSPIKEPKTLEELTEDHEIMSSSFRIEEIKYDTGLDEIKEVEEEDRCSPPSKLSTSPCPLRPRTPEEVQKIVAEVAEVLKSDKGLTEIIPDFDEKELERRLSQKSDDGGSVHRMLLTASSEDGGGETEICPNETTQNDLPQSPELSGKSSPEIRVDLAPDIDQTGTLDDLVEILSPDQKTSPASFEEKEKNEVSEKALVKQETTSKERKESVTSELVEPDRRESTFSTFSEKDMTCDESSIEEQKSQESRPQSVASHISDIKDEVHDSKIPSESGNAGKISPPIPASDAHVSKTLEKESTFIEKEEDDKFPPSKEDQTKRHSEKLEQFVATSNITQLTSQDAKIIQTASDKFPMTIQALDYTEGAEDKFAIGTHENDDQTPDTDPKEQTDAKPLDTFNDDEVPDEPVVIKEARSKSVSVITTATPYKLEKEFLDDSRKLPALTESISSSHESLARSSISLTRDSIDLTKFPTTEESKENTLSSSTKALTELTTAIEKVETTLTPEPDTSALSGKQSPDITSKSVDISSEKGKSTEVSEKSSGTLEKDSIDGSQTTENTTIEKDSLSLDSSKTGVEHLETIVSETMQIVTTTVIDEKTIPEISTSITETGEILEDANGRKTPPTVPVSPNIKNEGTQKESIDELRKESIQSAVSSIHGSTESVARSIPMSIGGQESGIETPESSPKPTAPFPKGLEAIKSETTKTSSGMSTPDMTRTSTPDEITHIESIDGTKTITKTIVTTTTTIITKDGDTVVSENTTTETSSDIKGTPEKIQVTSSTVHTLPQEYQSITIHKLGASDHESEDEGACSAMSTSPQPPASPYTTKFNFETEYEQSSPSTNKKIDIDDIDESQYDIPPQYDSAITLGSSTFKSDPMSTSFYGSLPEVETTQTEGASSTFTTQFFETVSSPIEVAEFRRKSSDKYFDEADLDFDKVMTSDTQSKDEQGQQQQEKEKKADETLASWGKPLGLPSPALTPADGDNRTTPKKERKQAAAKTKLNNEKNLRKRGESPANKKRPSPVYVDLAYVPHHGNTYYSHVEYFRRIRARYYVFSGTEPSREVYNALLEAKQTWEDKDLEVTIIPTYDTDVLGYWVSENEELLTKYHIDLSPSAARCTINLQDHETSCSAYRLEF